MKPCFCFFAFFRRSGRVFPAPLFLFYGLIFLKAVLSLKPKKIIYISCNPYTQVRDLQLLKNDYEIKYLQPVDMFPHTAHVECIVTLSLKH